MSARHEDLTVDGHLPEPELHAAIRAACRHLLPTWSAVRDDDIAIGFISGGISNALFKVAPTGQSAAPQTPPVAFRIYGANTDQFIDRGQELALMRLAFDNGFGPQVLATFRNGRIEEFLPMRSLTVRDAAAAGTGLVPDLAPASPVVQPEEMAAPECVPTIAASLRRFHAIPAPVSLGPCQLSVSKHHPRWVRLGRQTVPNQRRVSGRLARRLHESTSGWKLPNGSRLAMRRCSRRWVWGADRGLHSWPFVSIVIALV